MEKLTKTAKTWRKKCIFEYSYEDKQYNFWLFINFSKKVLNDIEPYDERGYLGSKDGGFILYESLSHWTKWYLKDKFQGISKKDINDIHKNIIKEFHDILKKEHIKVRKYDGHDE